jgi:hypothetical protein
MPVYLCKSFDQWKLALIFSPYKLELSMKWSCPDRLEIKNECYSTKPVNQQKTTIFALILSEEQRLNRFWSEKRCRNSTFTFSPPKKCPPFFFLTHTWWCENITASPCETEWFLLLTLNKVGINLEYSIPTRFQTAGPKVQKWMFLLFVHDNLIFHLNLLLMNSLDKSFSEKCI